jgi:predicted nuclease of predicted toxin-antitoxin system
VRILADENVEAIIARLRTDGHDVTAVIEDAPSTKDPAVLQTATRENRLLLTADHDFGDLNLPRPAARPCGGRRALPH